MFASASLDGIDYPSGSLELISLLHEVLDQLDGVVEWISRVLQPRYHLIACLIGSLPFNAVAYSPPLLIDSVILVCRLAQSTFICFRHRCYLGSMLFG